MPEITLLHPRENHLLLGHSSAEDFFLKKFTDGNIPHSWLISGVQGIGKATFAYRVARFLLSGGKVTKSNNLFGDSEISGMFIEKNAPIFSRVENNSHPDLLVIEPDIEAGKAEIAVDQIRRIGHFFAHTAGESKWRVVIIDSADDMNRNAANALLKALEEPPENAIIMLISHLPGRLLPTIRSRCQNIRLSPLSPKDAMEVLEKAAPDISKKEAEFVIAVSGGAPGLAAEIYANSGLELYGKIIAAFSDVPNFNISKIHEIGALVAKKDGLLRWGVFTQVLRWFIASLVDEKMNGAADMEFIEGEQDIRAQMKGKYSVDQLAELWEKLGRIVAETDGLNIDRKLSTTQIFGMFRAAV